MKATILTIACALGLASGIATLGWQGRQAWAQVGTGSTARDDLREHRIEVAGEARHFIVIEPDAYESPGPVVVLLHGGSQSMRKVLEPSTSTARWLELARDEGFLLLVPNGCNQRTGDPAGDRQTWNDLREDSGGRRSDHDDVAFVLTLLDWADKTHGIDRSRVYVTGSSNGGMMAMRLIIEAHEHFAAAAAFIASLPAAEVPDPAAGVPIMMMNGDQDPLVRWDGGPVGRGAAPSRSVEATVEYFLRANEVAGTDPVARPLPDSADDGCRVLETRYPVAEGEPSRVLFYRVEGGGHCMPDPDPPNRPRGVQRMLGTQCRDVHGADLAWRFMRSWGK